MRQFRYITVLVALIVCILVPACGKEETQVVRVESDDAEMDAAIEQARATLDEFLAALRSPRSGWHGFNIKKGFLRSDGSHEYIWLQQPEQQNDGSFSAYVNNVPVGVPGLREGQRVALHRDEIVDWMYLDETGAIVGGYTIRVLYDRAAAADRERLFGGELRFK